jgi:hypothetical protein
MPLDDLRRDGALPRGDPAKASLLSACKVVRAPGPLPLHVPNQSSLHAGVAVDVVFGRLDGAMAGEELDVA